MLKKIAEAVLQASLLGQGPLAGLFGTSPTGGGSVGGLLGGLFKGLFGRASGGPVARGQAYRVGENGPEMFIPNTNGRIAPGGAGGRGQQIQLVVSLSGDLETKVAQISGPIAVQVSQRAVGAYEAARRRSGVTGAASAGVIRGG